MYLVPDSRRTHKQHSRSRSRPSVDERSEKSSHEARYVASAIKKTLDRANDRFRRKPKSTKRESKYLDPFISIGSRPRSSSHTSSRRATWPPSPFVEDEWVSLARESISTLQLDDDKDEDIPNRGDINQESVIEPAYGDHIVPSECTSTISSSSIGTAAAQDDIQQFRGRQPSITTHLDKPELLDLSRRKPSPYVHTPSASQAFHTAYDSGYSSPEASFVKSAPPRSRKNTFDSSQRTSGLRELDVNVPHEISASPISLAGPPRDGVPPQKKTARYSMSGSDAKENPRASSTAQRPRPDKTPSDRGVSGTNVLLGLAGLGLAATVGSTPPIERPQSRRPRESREYEASRHRRDSQPQSGHSSGPQSRSNSRPESPALGYARYEEAPRRPATFPQAEQRPPSSYPASRLATASFPAADYHTTAMIDMPVMPSSRVYKPTASSSVPYPTDSMMPSEHQFAPQANNRRSVQAHAMPSLQNSQTFPSYASDRQNHHRAASVSSHQHPTRSIRSSSEPRFGPCHRAEPGYYNDWMTFREATYINICPSCFNATIGTSLDLRDQCRPSQQHAQPIACNFSSPWMRVALGITHDNLDSRDNALDFRRVYQMAHLQNTANACPGRAYAMRRWYTLRHDGHRISGFNVCGCDIAKIEALMPSFRGSWEESKSTGKERRCSLRTTSDRFGKLVDELIDVDSEEERIDAKRG
jgi:hypothetical protein